MKSSDGAKTRSRQVTYVALVGHPNTGKSTIFNALVGVRQRVANYPGVTVEKKSGVYREGQRLFEVIDLPGIVSLAVTSADELVTFEVLAGLMPETPVPDLVVVVVDATHLARQLYLVGQVLELGLPVVLVLNMMDVANREGIVIDVAGLEQRLGIPVIPTEAHRKRGIAELRQAISRISNRDSDPSPPARLQFPEVVEKEIEGITSRLRSFWVTLSQGADRPGGYRLRGLITGRGKRQTNPKGNTGTSQGVSSSIPQNPEPSGSLGSSEEKLGDGSPWQFLRFLATRLLLDVPDGLASRACLAVLPPELCHEVHSARERLEKAGIDLATWEPNYRLQWAEKLARGILRQEPILHRRWVEYVDGLLTHPVSGLMILALVIVLMFQAVFAAAEPLVQWLQAGVGWLALQMDHLLPEGILKQILLDGILSGLGTVLSFVPPIAILFLFVGILEDCGYLPRAAFVMDRWLAPLGLSGKCFLPLLTCFSCAIPGIMATRVIEDPRHRLRTMLVAPLIPCSARLPVFTLLIALFIPAEIRFLGGWISAQGLVLASMYFLGVATAGLAAWVLSRTVVAGPPLFFVLELPHYQWPNWSNIAYRVGDRIWRFLSYAGSVILVMTVIIWALLRFPNHPERVAQDPQVQQLRARLAALSPESPEHRQVEIELQQAENAAIQRQSFLGQFGRWIEPIFWPLGWDWRIGCAVLASFPAREVVVANLGVIFQLGELESIPAGERLDGIRQKLLAVRWEGSDRPLFSLPVALSIMVFFALCVQCSSTLIILARETRSWHWPLFTFVYLTTLAYLAAMLTYQISSRLL
jgi:ferrous iron transport protein B